jgi:hypothetical protein
MPRHPAPERPAEPGGHRQPGFRAPVRGEPVGAAAPPHGGGRHGHPVRPAQPPCRVRRDQVGDHGHHRDIPGLPSAGPGRRAPGERMGGTRAGRAGRPGVAARGGSGSAAVRPGRVSISNMGSSSPRTRGAVVSLANLPHCDNRRLRAAPAYLSWSRSRPVRLRRPGRREWPLSRRLRASQPRRIEGMQPDPGCDPRARRELPPLKGKPA